MYTSLVLATLVSTISIAQGLPSKWWKNTEGTPIENFQQFKELVASETATMASKHIFIDFYMQNCYWCYDFQQDWNQLVSDVTAMYGEENVAFLKVDGTKLYEVSNKYSVQSYPTFIYVTPNTKGMKAVSFRGNRTYSSMKRWMLNLLKGLTPLNQQGDDEESETQAAGMMEDDAPPAYR